VIDGGIAVFGGDHELPALIRRNLTTALADGSASSAKR
jgi:hypothetical protein